MAKKAEAVDAEFMIIKTELQKSTPEAKGVQVFDPENKEQVIQAFINAASLSFSTTPSDCKKLVKESAKLTIKDKDDKEGFEKVKAANWKLVKLRTGLENERKNLTEPFNKIKSGIDKIAKEDILGVTAKEEERTKNLLNQWAEWEQEEADRIENEAKEKLNLRVKELEESGIVFDGVFYSVGSVSVDVVTVKDLTEEQFEELKKRTSIEAQRIAEEKRVEVLHNERRELALPFMAYWTEEEKNINFGEVAELDFNNFMERIKKAAKDFEDEKKKQADEKKKNEDDRKALNYEKRSFRLEKEGFKESEFGNWFFGNDSGTVFVDKKDLEVWSVEDWEEGLKFALEKVERLNDLSKKVEDDKKKKDEEKAAYDKWNSRIISLKNVGFEHLGNVLKFNEIELNINDFRKVSDEEFAKLLSDKVVEIEKAKKEAEKLKETERLQKLPEIEKAERYIEEVVKVEIPALKTVEIAEIIAEFKNKIKLASDEALKSLKK